VPIRAVEAAGAPMRDLSLSPDSAMPTAQHEKSYSNANEMPCDQVMTNEFVADQQQFKA
jgi:hypothetical protein